eukprot:1176066-Prorocentrum_minimum.AAC.3
MPARAESSHKGGRGGEAHLVAEALAGAGGEDGQGGLARHHPVHGRQLARPELLVPEHLAQDDQKVRLGGVRRRRLHRRFGVRVHHKRRR